MKSGMEALPWQARIFDLTEQVQAPHCRLTIFRDRFFGLSETSCRPVFIQAWRSRPSEPKPDAARTRHCLNRGSSSGKEHQTIFFRPRKRQGAKGSRLRYHETCILASCLDCQHVCSIYAMLDLAKQGKALQTQSMILAARMTAAAKCLHQDP